MRGARKTMIGISTAASLALAAGVLTASAQGDGKPLDQGAKWTPRDRANFYSMDQGSEIMPLAWARALTGADSQPFLSDRLSRYGYLPNSADPELPVGFTAADRGGVKRLGMTCAACHTRQIEVGGVAYRVDGGPALSDFQSFLADLDQAVGRVVSDDAAFSKFADAVLRNGAPGDRQSLKDEVGTWYHRTHTLFARALPSQPWGLGRLDAVSMIFNRVSGLDIASAPDGIIESNIYTADAPVRYPFVWDAPKQDKTQWPGFADNGDVILGVARNVGEVYGVFANFHPVKDQSLLGYDFHTNNSANFNGLDGLESLVRKIGAPVWPWMTDHDQVMRGKSVFDQTCASCHSIRPGTLRLFPVSQTWHTLLVDVGTDTRQYDVLARTADTGVMQGARYGLGGRLGAQDRQFNILAATVIGSMADHLGRHGLPPDALFQPIQLGSLASGYPVEDPMQELTELYHTDAAEKAVGNVSHPYEARVLHGIWATAPYLHNGSVASLAELLKKPADRLSTFPIGPSYDLENVGIALVQPSSKYQRHTTGCEDIHSGNSHCGHDFGTNLLPDQKRDLLEYLKTL